MSWLITAEDPIKKSCDFDGIQIDIEWPKGSIRTWKGSDYKRKMYADYGRIPSTIGADKEEVDVYVGDNRDSRKVFEVTQVRKDTGDFDEAKYILGADSLEEAQELYLAHMDQENFGGIVEMPWSEFKRLVDDVLAK
jgi:hypothetical protein